MELEWGGGLPSRGGRSCLRTGMPGEDLGPGVGVGGRGCLQAVQPQQPATTQNAPSEQVLTPQEFVEAGDYLVQSCPTWSW